MDGERVDRNIGVAGVDAVNVDRGQNEAFARTINVVGQPAVAQTLVAPTKRQVQKEHQRARASKPPKVRLDGHGRSGDGMKSSDGTRICRQLCDADATETIVSTYTAAQSQPDQHTLSFLRARHENTVSNTHATRQTRSRRLAGSNSGSPNACCC